MKLSAAGAILAAVVLGAGALMAACGGGGEEKAATPTTEQSPPAAAESGTLHVELDDFYFEPKEIQGEVGKAMTLELENEGSAPHTFTIDELGIDQEVQPGGKATVAVTPETDGTLAFYCRFHRSQGMEGELTVSGAGGSAAPPSGAGSGESGGGYSVGY